MEVNMDIENITHTNGHPFIESDGYQAPASAYNVAAEALFPVEYIPSSYVDPQGILCVPRYESGRYAGEPLNVYVVRNDTNEALGLHSGKYDKRADGYQTVIETAERLFPNSATSCTLFGQGERMLLTQDIGEIIDVGGGDSLLPQIVWTSSLNGTWSTSVHHVSHRLFCANQLIDSSALWKVRRTRNHGSMVEIRAEILRKSQERAQAQAQIARVLSDQDYTNEQFYSLVERLTPFEDDDSERKKNQALRTRASMHAMWKEEVQAWGKLGTGFQYYGNRWLAYNAVQGAEQHRVNARFKRGEEHRLSSLMKSVEGKTPLADKAHALLVMGK